MNGKKWLCALLSVVLTLSLVGCNPSDVEFQDETQNESNKESLLNLSDVKLTAGTSANDSGGFVMNTEVENNRFDCVCFMVHNLEEDTYVTFCRGTYPGKFTDFYTHTQPSGTYDVIIKGNTNLKDERATFQIELEEGQTYAASFTVDSFSEQHIEISDVSFS